MEEPVEGGNENTGKEGGREESGKGTRGPDRNLLKKGPGCGNTISLKHKKVSFRPTFADDRKKGTELARTSYPFNKGRIGPRKERQEGKKIRVGAYTSLSEREGRICFVSTGGLTELL